jgi:acetolactate synthase small subunit
MKIKIEASNYFNKNLENTNFEMDIPKEKNKIIDVIKLLEIPEDEVGFATVNDIKVNFNQVLNENDCLGLYPFIIGG